MADEILNRDQNHVTVLGAVTDDSNEEVVMLRVDPVSKRLLVSAIGIPGAGTVTSVSVSSANGFAGTVANPTSTPAITLSTTVTGILKGNGTAISAATPGTDYLVDITGLITQGSNITITGTGTSGDPYVINAAGAASAYNTFENEGVAVTQRTAVNLSDLLTASDSGGKTALTVNVSNLAADPTFLASLDLGAISGQIDLATQVTGQLDASNIDQASLDLASIGGSLNLASQVTGTLPVANGGTGATTLTGILHGNGTSAFTAIPLTTNGAILIGDGSGEPTTLSAFSSSTGTLNVANGGTGIASYAVGDILYASGATTLSKLADVATGNALISGGVTTAPLWGKIGLSTHISGTLPLANGGTGASLSDPGYDSVMTWDNTTNAVRFPTLSGLSYNSGTNTLTAASTVDVLNVTQFEDFIGIVSTAVVTGQDTFIGVTQWSTGNGTANISSVTSVANRPGIIQVSNSNANGDGIVWGELTNFYPSTTFNLEYLVKIPTANVSEEYFFGVSSGLLGASFTGNANKIGIVGTSGNWKGITSNGAAATQSSGSASITGDAWVNLKITFDGTTVDFLVDNVSVGTITATLPATACGFSMLTRNVGGGAAGVFQADYVKINYEITR